LGGLREGGDETKKMKNCTLVVGPLPHIGPGEKKKKSAGQYCHATSLSQRVVWLIGKRLSVGKQQGTPNRWNSIIRRGSVTWFHHGTRTHLSSAWGAVPISKSPGAAFKRTRGE